MFDKFFRKLDACAVLQQNREAQLQIISNLHSEKEEQILARLVDEENVLRAILVS